MDDRRLVTVTLLDAGRSCDTNSYLHSYLGANVLNRVLGDKNGCIAKLKGCE